MPAVLQLLTIVLIFSLESNAVLAVVVTQTPRIALGSQTGAGGVGVGVGGVVPPPVVPDLAQLMQKDSNMARITIRKGLYREKIRLFCMYLQ
jgi:hypothetical protein